MHSQIFILLPGVYSFDLPRPRSVAKSTGSAPTPAMLATVPRMATTPEFYEFTLPDPDEVTKSTDTMNKTDFVELNHKPPITCTETSLAIEPDTSEKLDFSEMQAETDRRASDAIPNLLRGTKLAEKYRDGAYPFKTVNQYKKAKGYPSRIDVRLLDFDPKKETTRLTVCAHGTSLESVLRAIRRTNMQLVPGIKQIKLTGSLSKTGESGGVTDINRKYVSTVPLWCRSSHYDDVIEYAKAASTKFNKSTSRESTIPVVAIGDGVGETTVVSNVENEVGFKRVNIRIVACQNIEERDQTAALLKKEMQKSGSNADIRNLRLCTFDDLQKARMKIPSYPYPFPDIPVLWEIAVPVAKYG